MQVGIVLVAAVCAFGCQTPRERTPPEPLPVLEPPPDLTDREEPLYVRAHLEQFIRSLYDKDDMRFDYHKHVYHHYFWLMDDLDKWFETMDIGNEWMDFEIKYKLVRRTPASLRYMGARQRAVALGLLARLLWVRNPPRDGYWPNESMLKICARFIFTPKCRASSRERALRRAMLMGKYAHTKLYNEMIRRTKEHIEAKRKEAAADDR